MTPDEKREYQREYWRKRREADPDKVRADSRERNRRYRERNREEYNARWRAWAADNKDRIHGYYIANADVVKARSRKRYEENREELIQQASERQRERLRTDPEFYQSKLDAWHLRRARKLANGPVDDIDRRAVWGRDAGCCTLCGGFVPFAEMELDHVVPLSQGGTHTWNNVQTAHARCNRSKGAKVLLGLAGRGQPAPSGAKASSNALAGK
jgi:5-methylcytosine-specific restriction endonuclease McrA